MLPVSKPKDFVLCCVLLSCCLFLMSLFAGCGDEESPPCAPCAAGTISGRILSAGRPIRTRVGALQVQPNGPYSGQVAYVQTVSDSTGAYTLDLPAGRYVLRMDGFNCDWYYAHGTLVDEQRAETLLVNQGTSITADLNAASLHVDITAPVELDGARVRASVVSAENNCDSYSWTDFVRDGHAIFDFDRLMPGAYRVLFSTSEGSGFVEIWLPGTTVLAEADTIEVHSGRIRNYEATLPEAAIFRGTITGSWQDLGQSAPQLVLRFPDQDRSQGYTRVDPEDGSFELRFFAVARFVLVIDIASFPRWYGGSSEATATPLEVEPGQVLELNLRESGIAGWLNRYNPNSSVEVSLWDRDMNPCGNDRPTGERGFFRFSNLTVGTYYLKIGGGPNWIEQWYDHADSLSAAAPIHVTGDGEVVWLDLDLENGGRIEGRLMREDGVPAFGVPLTLIDSRSHEAIRYGQSDGGAGGFGFDALPDGDYILAARPNEVQTTIYYPGVTELWQATVLTIRDHAQITDVFFDLP